jgi:hypothetical protein
MRTLTARLAVIVLVAVVLLAVAVAALGSQPTGVKYSGRIPDVPCAAGQSPEKSPFCLVTPDPNVSKMPDTNVPPEPSKADSASPPPGIVLGSDAP